MAEVSESTSQPETGSACLYADLLLALVGHEGNVFERDARHGITRLSEVVDWVPDSDRPHLDRLCRLGDACAELLSFVEASAQHDSLYRTAMANGVTGMFMKELLDVYEESVLNMEQDLALHPTTPVIALCHQLEEFQTLLPAIARLVRHVSEDDHRGARLLHVVHAATLCGDPQLESCAARLLWHCQGTMLRQLHAWCAHGALPGPSGEFFVRQAATLQFCMQVPEAEDDLPPCVGPQAAADALFIGKAVRVLRGGAPGASPGLGGTWPEAGAAGPGSESCLACLDTLAAGLVGLAAAPSFRPAQLERLLGEARQPLAAAVWALLRGQALGARLASMRDYFLLGRGDFYQQFLAEAAALLAAPPRPATASADVGLLFQHAALHTTAEEDPGFGAFALTWHMPGAAGAPPPPPDVYLPTQDAWDGLALRATLDWPLQLLFPPDILARYGALWALGLRLRRADAALGQAWAALQRLDRPRRRAAGGAAGSASPHARAAAALGAARQRAAHLLTHLRLYLHADVAAAAATDLEADLAQAREFGAAEAAHRVYVARLVSRAFLDTRPLASLMQALLDASHQVCDLVQDLESGRQDPEATLGALRAPQRELRLKTELMLQIMRSGTLQMKGRAPALRHLVLRLTFNGFL